MLRAGIARLVIDCGDALGASVCQVFKKVQTVGASLDLDALAPQGHVQLRVQLGSAERGLVLLQLHEGTVVAVGTHIHALLLNVELVGHDLKRLCEVLDSEGTRLYDLLPAFLRFADRRTLVNLAVFDLCDGLGEDSADFLSVEEVSIRGQARQFRHEKVQTGVLLGAEIDKSFEFSIISSLLFQLLNEGDLRLEVSPQVAAVVVGKDVDVVGDVQVNLLVRAHSLAIVGGDAVVHVGDLAQGALHEFEVDEGEQGAVGAHDSAQSL